MTLLHAFVSGLGAGLAFAFCQGLASWLYNRASRKRYEGALRAMREHHASAAYAVPQDDGKGMN